MRVVSDYQICACVDQVPELLSPLCRGQRHQLVSSVGANDDNLALFLGLAYSIFSLWAGKACRTRSVADADTEFAFAEREDLKPHVPW
jgi:hypothetical protein